MGSVAPKLVIGAQSAKAAGLRYATCDKPGITRQKRGKTFIYKDPKGRVLTDAKTLARIRALVLPPAWTDVWISADPRSFKFDPRVCGSNTCSTSGPTDWPTQAPAWRARPS